MRLFFFSSTRYFVIMDGPDPFSSSRRPGRAKARRAAMAEAPDREPDAMDMAEKGSKGRTRRPMGGGGVECGVRRAVRCDGRTDGGGDPPAGGDLGQRVGAALGVPLGTSDAMAHGMDGIWRMGWTEYGAIKF